MPDRNIQAANRDGEKVNKPILVNGNAVGGKDSGVHPALQYQPPSKSIQRTKVSLSDLGSTWTEVGQVAPTDSKYPTAFDATLVFDNPLDNYYLITSPYSTTELNLYTAPSVDGPYTDRGVIIEAESDSIQADSPHAVHVPEKGELWIYYHEATGSAGSGNQYTMIAKTPTSGDGTSYTKHGSPTAVLDGNVDGHWDDNERTYFSVRREGGMWYGTYQGRDEAANERGIGVAWSTDGINWETQYQPFGFGSHMKNYDPKTSNLNAPSLVRIGGELFVFYADRSANSRDVYAFSFNQRNELLQHSDATKMFRVAEDRMVEMCDTITIGNRTYVFYHDRLGYFDWGEYL